MSPTIDGAAFVLDAPKEVPAVWGDGTRVLWSSGEPMLLCGPPGVGKSTLIQQFVRVRLGVGEPELLGLPVKADPDARVLYVAADRPAQIARSLGRMFDERHRTHLSRHLVIERAPTWQLHMDPAVLRDLALMHEANLVVLDSLKDLASPLSDDGVGTTVKHALVACNEVGIEVCALHHQRKGNAENRRPTKLDDVYGSTWLTAGAGSVVLLHGQAGDPVVELLHLKQPADEVGPLTIVHDHVLGVSRVSGQVDLVEILAARGSLTVRDAAVELYGPDPTANHVEKARRKLTDLENRGLVEKLPGDGPKTPVTYVAKGRVIARDSPRDRSRPYHGSPESPSTGITPLHAATEGASPYRGGGSVKSEREARPRVTWDDDDPNIVHLTPRAVA